MTILDSLLQPSKLPKDDAQRMRLMYMLIRVGVHKGYGTGKLAGYVFVAYDGVMYSVTQNDVWKCDYVEFTNEVAAGGIPFQPEK